MLRDRERRDRGVARAQLENAGYSTVQASGGEGLRWSMKKHRVSSRCDAAGLGDSDLPACADPTLDGYFVL